MTSERNEPQFIAHIYRGPDPDSWSLVRLVCPWGDGSGMIPPPTIKFGDVTFRWVGTEDA